MSARPRDRASANKASASALAAYFGRAPPVLDWAFSGAPRGAEGAAPVVACESALPGPVVPWAWPAGWFALSP